MSSGNMLLGTAKGRLGSIVFSRSNGQQQQRTYIPHPRNPRSNTQMMQRASFLNAQKFYTRGVQNLFKYAYESKRPGESDFNAFMRANVKRSPVISQAAANEPTYPAIGNWQMSQGSIAALSQSIDTAGSKVKLDLQHPKIDDTHWGDICTELIATYGLQQGDIVTAVKLNASGSTAANTPDVAPAPRNLITWSIAQARIDVNNTDSVPEAFGVDWVVQSVGVLCITLGSSTEIAAGCFYVSRKTKNGVKVSNSYLVNNQGATQAISACSAESYVSQVLESWKANGPSILEGSMSEG